jgi:membrane associated rhomboid family serine protease
LFCLPVPKDKFQTSTPWVISIIAIVDALLLIPFYSSDKTAFFAHYAFIPSHPTLLTLFSALFLHAGLLHYAGKMWFLWIFGRKVECTLGSVRFAGLYLLCGFGGQVIYLLLNLHSNIPLVGASGAISGVAGFYFVLFPHDRFNLHLYLGWWHIKTVDATTRMAVGAWIGEQVVLALITQVAQFSSVAFWAHVGGFAAGAGLGAIYHSCVPKADRPSIPLIALEGEDAEEQPSNLTTLKLN